jgi:dienelactone hydrolase
VTPRRSRGWLIVAVASLLVVGVAAVLVSNTMGRQHGWIASQEDPEDLSALLAPAYRLRRPEGAGPFPAALLASGCDGPKGNLERMADRLAQIGWASLIVDSHGPRELDRLEAWRLVCAGQMLTGAERAGDLAVALADLRQTSFVDARRVALIGASHGGWAILDLMVQVSRNQVPPTLSRWPEGAAPLSGVVGAVLLYPYCGFGSLGGPEAADFALMFLLVEDDAIADEAPCLRLAERLREQGAAVEVEVFSGVTHGFDQQEKNAFSTLEYDPAATERSLELIGDFLREVAQ